MFTPVLFPVLIFALPALFVAMPVYAADIVSARFIMPTERYDHCVLGDCVEYEAIEAVLDDGSKRQFRLGPESVFEDTTIRLISMPATGRTAILAVRARLSSGAALSILELRDNNLQITAESPPIGIPHRWQNPIGMADFDNDGVPEIATVITPHIGGILTLYERDGDRLVKDKAVHGFSNHRYGATILDLHEILDWNRDGVPDIVLPDMTRSVLKVISFATGQPEMIAQYDAGLQIEGPVTAIDQGVAFDLGNGIIERWQR